MATTRKRRQRIRDELWPDASGVTYHHKEENGFFTSPRTLPMIARLAKELSKGIDPSQVYLELWARSFDPPGFVEIIDEEECANAAGFMGGGVRSIRSWRERVRALEQLGFVRVGEKGSRSYAYVLILHPHTVVQSLHEAGSVSERWWSLFRARLRDIGAAPLAGPSMGTSPRGPAPAPRNQLR